MSIALFFLISGFFLAVLLAALEHSRRLLAVAGGCLVAVVCIIVFLTPVDLPSWHFGRDDDSPTTIRASVTAGITSTTNSTLWTTTTSETPRVQFP